MAAIDPTAEPKSHGPKRATLKIIRRPISSLYDGMSDSDDDSEESDEDEEDSEDDSEDDSEESEDEAPKKGGETDKKKSVSEDKMDVDSSGQAGKKSKGELDDLSDDDMDSLEMEEFVVCTLDVEKNYQQPITLTIRDSEDIFFKVVGNYDVFLTGNYINNLGQGEGEDEYDEDYDLSPSEDESEPESEDELDGLENPRIREIDTDEEEEETSKKGPKKVDAKQADKKADKKDDKKADKKADKKGTKRAAEETPEKSTEKQKKSKANDGKAVPAESATPIKKEDKKVKFAKLPDAVHASSPAGKKSEKKEHVKEKKKEHAKEDKGDVKKDAKKQKEEKKEKQPTGNTGPRNVNGVTVDDRTIGTGPQAKSGQKVNMRYVGKLSDGKIFDSNTKGKPFSFQLGKGEVIKGWDIGIQGMQPGGERRITIPANLGYGKRAMPGIPANSTLIFDVKLLAIK